MSNDDEIRNDEAHTPPPPPEDNGTGTLEGERGLPSVNTRRSSGTSFLKTIGLMVAGVAALVLMAVAILPRHQAPAPKTGEDSQVINHLPAIPALSRPPPPPASTAPAPPAVVQASPKPQGMTPEQQLMARRQRAPIIAYGGAGQSADQDAGQVPAGQVATATPVTANYGPGLGESHRHPPQRDELAQALQPTSTPRAYASVLPDRNFLITKGTFLDCALETAIDSTVAGFTSCRLTRSVYSDNGRVLLLERGSRITGQYQSGQVRPGMNRIFVLWDRVETPNGVVVDLDSPGIDALGRSGLPGHVNHHFIQRFGAALMLSLIDDYVKYQIAKEQNSQQVQFTDTTSQTQQLAAIALQDSIDIPPTLFKNQGDHIKVYVARDIDFRNVYRLEAKQDEVVVRTAAPAVP